MLKENLEQTVVECKGVRGAVSRRRHHFRLDAVNESFFERSFLLFGELFIKIFGADQENSVQLRVFQVFVEENWEKLQ